MTELRRARLGLVLAVLVAAVVLILELPVGELFHQRAELAALDARYAAVSSENHALSSSISSLTDPSTIAAVAHEEYGLVGKNQRSYVVMPGGADTPGSANTLAQEPLPKNDLVASAAPLSGTVAEPTTHTSLWSRVYDRLAFWRWAL